MLESKGFGSILPTSQSATEWRLRDARAAKMARRCDEDFILAKEIG
ncbi:hypothetical protein IQ273_20550 [Nodosilinea sp. LEGE 07298]|nr:hypothetical protein [Nodosilinea sp. LEGE 07298]